MRRILNLFITGLILWMASKMAPEQVQIKDFGTLALATVSLWLVTIMIYVISLLFTVRYSLYLVLQADMNIMTIIDTGNPT